MSETQGITLPPTGERYLPVLKGDIVAEHLHRYLYARPFVEGKRVLDIASGEGYGSRLLAETAAHVVGVDIAPDAVAYASGKYTQDNLEFRQGECSAIPLPDASVDVVVSFETLEHHDQHQQMMREIKRVLVPGGLLVLSSPDRRQYSDIPCYKNPYHVKELYRDELEVLLREHFTNHQLFGQRVVYGSLIAAEHADRLQIYREGKSQGYRSLTDAMYWIAIASDKELPASDNSLFDHDIHESTAVRDAVEATRTQDLLHREQLDVARREQQELFERLSVTQRDAEAVQANLAEMHQAIAASHARDAEYREQLDAAQQEKNVLLEELAAAQHEHQELLEDIEGAQREVEDTRAHVEVLRQNEQALSAQLNVAQQSNLKTLGQLESVHRSKHEIIEQYATFVNRSLQSKSFLEKLTSRIARYFSGRHIMKLERQRVIDSGLFDADWYMAQNPDVVRSGQDALTHYLIHGGYEGRDPSPHFSTLSWLESHSELIERHRHPLLHYLDARHSISHQHEDVNGGLHDDDRAVKIYDQLTSAASSPSGDYVAQSSHALTEPSRVRAIALYLPQFHPIPENDKWWGRGFTEWTNVSKAVPQYVGHYQPRLPGELGFYDLRVKQIQERQAELAEQYGLAGFCFHYYWFSGRKRLLELPLNQYVENKNIDFPFCVCWANENWTRRWDGLEQDILMEQRHEPQDNLEFIEDLLPLLKDPRYIRINGKPILIVYRVSLLPNPQETVRVWREYCRQHGVGELHLVAAQSFGIGDPRSYGFDAAMEFPPHNVNVDRINDQLEFANDKFSGNVYDYEQLVDRQLAKPVPDYKLYRTVFNAWDNEARKPGRGDSFKDASPELYKRWLNGVCAQADQAVDPDEKVVFINAWNEWAEGAYLEPDRRYGYAYLRATREALAHYPTQVPDLHSDVLEKLKHQKKQHDIAVVLHLFYPELWPEIFGSLKHIEGGYDLYVSVPDTIDLVNFKQLMSDVPHAVLLPFPNRGRDVAPFLTIMKGIQHLGYQAVCKLHGKRSLHRSDGDNWRNFFFENLVGSELLVKKIIRAFSNDPKLGMVGPTGQWLELSRFWGSNSPQRLQAAAERMGVSEEQLKAQFFFAGSMFWFRPEALAPMFNAIHPDEFELELGQVDGTLAHGLERLFVAVVEATGMRITDNLDLRGKPRTAHDYAFAVATPPPVAAGSGTVRAGLASAGTQLSDGNGVVENNTLRTFAKRIPFARTVYRTLRSS